MKKQICIVSILLSIYSIALIGQTAVINTNLQTIKIKAKKEINDPASTSLNTSIITSEEIKAMGAKNVAEAIKYTAGVSSLLQGTSSLIYLRGARPDSITVLINGQKINKAQGNAGQGVDLAQYGVANIERIEIIKGAAATRYGGDAMGGVINIITRERAYNIDGVDAILSYGSYNTMFANAIISKTFGTNQRGNIVVDGGLFYSKGDYKYDLTDSLGNRVMGKMENNSAIRGNARVGISYKLNEDNDSIFASVSAYTLRAGIQGNVFSFPSLTAYNDIQTYTADISYENYSIPFFNLFARLNTVINSRIYDDKSFSTHDRYQNIGTEAAINLEREDYFGDNIFTWYNNIEVSYRNDYFTTENPRTGILKGKAKNVQRNTASIAYMPTFGFLKYEESEVNRLEIIPSIRFDAVIGDGALTNKSYYEPTYAVGVMYTFDKEKRYIIKGNFNTAYRLPTFEDLYWYDASGFTVGNVNLKKESSIGGDAGFIINPIDIIRFEAVYYVTSATNMIVWSVDDRGLSVPFNLDSTIMQGVELNLLITVPIKPALSSIELNANYSYQFGRILKSAYTVYDPVTFAPTVITVNNTKLPRIPENSFSGMLSYVYEGDDIFSGRLNFLVNYTGERFDNVQNTIKLKEHTTFDITASLMFLNTITVEGGVKNVMDVRYEDVYGYPLAGREWYVSLSGRF